MSWFMVLREWTQLCWWLLWLNLFWIRTAVLSMGEWSLMACWLYCFSCLVLSLWLKVLLYVPVIFYKDIFSSSTPCVYIIFYSDSAFVIPYAVSCLLLCLKVYYIFANALCLMSCTMLCVSWFVLFFMVSYVLCYSSCLMTCSMPHGISCLVLCPMVSHVSDLKPS